MPASSSESLVHVEEKLRASFADGTELDHLVASSSKQILLHKIDFKAAEKPYSLQLDTLKSKYIHLNPGQSASSYSASNASKTGTMSVKEVGDGLPTPKVVLYPEEKVRLEWRKVHRVGSGLHNMGNTCFLNSTLQCLTYTAPLVNFCLSEEHSSVCKQQGFCMMCELQRHIRRCYNNNGHAIKPQAILQKLKMIAKHMHWGRQEDAHEFLRYVVDGLQKACLNGFAKLDKISKETTVVNQIFGGFLRSQVQCLKCKERSNTYDPVMDISLDIKNVQSVERAFEKFVQPETLDNENAYMCPRCKQKVTAQKRLSIHKPPNVLTLQLKRFDINRMFGKISRNIQFQDTLNVRPYMSIRQGEPVMYQLYAVLVHSGSACNMGHYYCYVKSSSQTWYCMNDSTVQQVNSGRVFNAEAYLLFYTRSRSPNNNNNNNNTPKLKGTIIGPQLPQKHPHNHVSSLTTKISGPSKDTGTAIPRNPFKVAPPVIRCEELKKKCTINPTSIPPPERRSKISFGIRLGASGKEAATGSREQENSKEENQNKPRIVMQIKHGKVTTFETSPNGKAKIMESDTNVKHNRLVPYGEDSDSEVESKGVKGSVLPEGKLLNGSRTIQPSVKPSTVTSLGSVNGSVIFDEKLNATMSVPGNTNLLETTREKFQKSNSNHQKKSPESGRNGSSSPIKNSKDSTLSKGKDLTLKLHSKSMPSSQSPTKQSASGGLTCVISPTNLKVNSTTSWQVKCQESVLSPSLGSTSSTGSVNSTTDWQIKEQTVSTKCERVLESPGWTVTSDSKTTSGVKDHSQKHSPKSHLSTDTMLIPRILEIQKSIDTKCMLSKAEDHQPSACGDSNHPRSVLSPPHTDTVDVSDKQPLLNGFLDSDEERVARKKHKKAKKHKKRKAEENCDHDYQKLSDESPTKKSKKKKKKHKHHHDREHGHHHGRDENSSKDADSEHEDSPEYEWVEKPAVQPKLDKNSPPVQTKVEITDSKQTAAIDITSFIGHSMLDRTSPKRQSKVDISSPKRHSTVDMTSPKRPSTVDMTSPKRPSTVDMMSPKIPSTVDMTSPKRPSSVDMTSPKRPSTVDMMSPKRPSTLDMTSPKRHSTLDMTSPKRHSTLDITSPKRHSTVDMTSPKRHSTLDTQSAEDTTSTKKSIVENMTSPQRHSQLSLQPDPVKSSNSPSKHSAIKTVPVQQWDEFVWDPHKATNGRNGKRVTASSWDGAKSSSVVAELEKHSSNRGYGASVFSWEGDQSHLDKDVDEESRKRQWSDEYEDEIDSGKTKKVKKHQSDIVVMGYGANPFQKQQDDRNKNKQLVKNYSHGHSIEVSHGSSGHHDSHHRAPGSLGSNSWYNGGSSHHSSHSDHHYHSNHDSHHHNSNKHHASH